MTRLTARVRNGRLVLDEPTDLPEGQIVELQPVGTVDSDQDDGLDDEERERLHAALRKSLAEADAGKLVDAREVFAKLRARR